MKQKLTFNERMILIAKKYSLALKWQQLKYGFSRAVIDCGSYEEMYARKIVDEQGKCRL